MNQEKLTSQEAWAPFKDYSEKASANGRRLALGGLAFSWAIKPDNTGLDWMHKMALVLLLVYFVLDVAHYVVAAALHRRWARSEECRLWNDTQQIDTGFVKPASLDKPAWIMFWGKLTLLVSSFCLLIPAWYRMWG